MATLAIEYAQGILWMAGNVLPSQERKLGSALSRYLDESNGNGCVVDMSAVKYLSSYAAKTLLMAAQETCERGRKLKVRSSLSVERTLLLLGADAWCELETCRRPNRWPFAPSDSLSPGTTPTPGEGDSLRIKPSTVRRKRSTRILPVTRRDSEARDGRCTDESPSQSIDWLPQNHEAQVAQHDMTEHRASGIHTDGTSVLMTQQETASSPAPRDAVESMPVDLAPASEGAVAVSKRLVVMKTYTFHMAEKGSTITGRLLERMDGAWVRIDSEGEERMVNLRYVSSIDVHN